MAVRGAGAGWGPGGSGSHLCDRRGLERGWELPLGQLGFDGLLRSLEKVLPVEKSEINRPGREAGDCRSGQRDLVLISHLSLISHVI